MSKLGKARTRKRELNARPTRTGSGIVREVQISEGRITCVRIHSVNLSE